MSVAFTKHASALPLSTAFVAAIHDDVPPSLRLAEDDAPDQAVPGAPHDNSLLRQTEPSGHPCRYRRVRISCALLQDLVTQDSASGDFPWGARCVEGVPPDARIVHALVEGEGTSAVLVMIFEHASWEAVPEGHAIPDFLPVFQRERRDES